jgi:hypothetical protein
MKQYHPKLYNMCVPPGNTTSLDYNNLGGFVTEIE